MSVRVSSLRERTRERPVVGTFVKLRALEAIEICAQTLDFAVIDLEHSQLSEADAFALVRHAYALRFPAVVRIPELDRGLVNRLLETGAAGVQLSTVRSRAQVEELRRAALYAPEGTRSISLAHSRAAYGRTAVAEYVRSVERPLVVAQVETLGTDDPLDEILAAAPDVVFVGALDLLVDAGLDEDRAARRRDEIAAAAERAGIALGGTSRDYSYAVVSSDVALLGEAVAGVR